MHTRATKVTVRVRSSQTRVRLEVEDDGAGFDPEQVGASRLGIKIMSERIHQLDGVLRFDVPDSAGTLLVAEVPVRPMDLLAIPAQVTP
jgi:signal transduction histidine kinase